jgi:hypothetical protein
MLEEYYDNYEIDEIEYKSMNVVVQAILDAKSAGEEGYTIEDMHLLRQCEADVEFSTFMTTSGFYACRWANKLSIIFDRDWEHQFKTYCKEHFPEIISKYYRQDAHGLLGGGYRFSYVYKNECLIDIIAKTRKECYAKVMAALERYK